MHACSCDGAWHRSCAANVCRSSCAATVNSQGIGQGTGHPCDTPPSRSSDAICVKIPPPSESWFLDRYVRWSCCTRQRNVKRSQTAGQGLAQPIFVQKCPKKKPHAGCTRLRGVGHIAKQVEKNFRKCPKMSEISPKMSEIWRQNFFCPTKNISNAKFETQNPFRNVPTALSSQIFILGASKALFSALSFPCRDFGKKKCTR